MPFEDHDHYSLMTHSLAWSKLAQLRDVQIEQFDFRRGLVNL